MSAYVFYIKQNDHRPKLQVQLQNADGTPLNLGSATVAFRMRKKNSATSKIDGAPATVTSASTGMVEYEWQNTDTDTIAEYRAEFIVTWSAGIEQTFPEDDYIKVVVKDDL